MSDLADAMRGIRRTIPNRLGVGLDAIVFPGGRPPCIHDPGELADALEASGSVALGRWLRSTGNIIGFREIIASRTAMSDVLVRPLSEWATWFPIDAAITDPDEVITMGAALRVASESSVTRESSVLGILVRGAFGALHGLRLYRHSRWFAVWAAMQGWDADTPAPLRRVVYGALRASRGQQPLKAVYGARERESALMAATPKDWGSEKLMMEWISDAEDVGVMYGCPSVPDLAWRELFRRGHHSKDPDHVEFAMMSRLVDCLERIGIIPVLTRAQWAAVPGGWGLWDRAPALSGPRRPCGCWSRCWCVKAIRARGQLDDGDASSE